MDAIWLATHRLRVSAVVSPAQKAWTALRSPGEADDMSPGIACATPPKPAAAIRSAVARPAGLAGILDPAIERVDDRLGGHGAGIAEGGRVAGVQHLPRRVEHHHRRHRMDLLPVGLGDIEILGHAADIDR